MLEHTDGHRPWFFVHIRKTAGSAVRSALANRFSVRRTLLDWHYERHREAALEQFDFVTGHCPYTAVHRFSIRPRVLVFLREPMERALSAFDFYSQWTAAQIQDAHDTLRPDVAREREAVARRGAELGLCRFLDEEPTLARRWLGNVQTRVLAGATETDPELPHSESALLDLALRHLTECDAVGLTENVGESLRRLPHWDVRLTGLAAPRMNTTPRRTRRDSVPRKTLERLTEWNRLDIEVYRVALARFEAETSAGAIASGPGAGTAASPGDAADFAFDQPIIGPGWHPREWHDGRWICWTGPQTTARLHLHRRSGVPVEIAIRVEHVLSPDVLDGLRICLNDRPLEWRRESRDGVLWLTVAASVAVLPVAGGPFTLSFETPRTIRPVDLQPGCGDERSLGIALSRIQCRSLTADGAARRPLDRLE